MVWSDTSFFQKTSDGLDGPPVGFLLRVGPVESGPDAVQDKTDSRPEALVPFRSQRHQQRLDIRPFDVGPNRVGKNGVESFLMFADHGHMISDISIMSSINSFFIIWFILLMRTSFIFL